MIAMFPLILVQFLNESILVALIDMVLVSSPVPSPLHTINNLEKKNSVQKMFYVACMLKTQFYILENILMFSGWKFNENVSLHI